MGKRFIDYRPITNPKILYDECMCLHPWVWHWSSVLMHRFTESKGRTIVRRAYHHSKPDNELKISFDGGVCVTIIKSELGCMYQHKPRRRVETLPWECIIAYSHMTSRKYHWTWCICHRLRVRTRVLYRHENQGGWLKRRRESISSFIARRQAGNIIGQGVCVTVLKSELECVSTHKQRQGVETSSGERIIANSLATSLKYHWTGCMCKSKLGCVYRQTNRGGGQNIIGWVYHCL